MFGSGVIMSQTWKLIFHIIVSFLHTSAPIDFTHRRIQKSCLLFEFHSLYKLSRPCLFSSFDSNKLHSTGLPQKKNVKASKSKMASKMAAIFTEFDIWRIEFDEKIKFQRIWCHMKENKILFMLTLFWLVFMIIWLRF